MPLQAVLRQPSPQRWSALQEALLAALRPRPSGIAPGAGRHFYRYLVELQTILTARQYSELASWLDITAVGLVAFEEIIRGTASGWRDLLIAMASEGAMVLGSRQYIKAWAVESGPIHEDATWALREALWRLSEETQPDLAPGSGWTPCAAPCRLSLAQAQPSARAVAWAGSFRRCC